eukprot:TRINITY_DN2646_c0_g1_i3.p1 TRINITY_DN2646_c0_g1~~TRINITY_DN2646_c0_g1_i3.p1  ORF type:complete len:120 (+),score=18.09 TRINITY_DN2646_c0_g1_i3:46-405(+)
MDVDAMYDNVDKSPSRIVLFIFCKDKNESIASKAKGAVCYFGQTKGSDKYIIKLSQHTEQKKNMHSVLVVGYCNRVKGKWMFKPQNETIFIKKLDQLHTDLTDLFLYRSGKNSSGTLLS